MTPNAVAFSWRTRLTVIHTQPQRSWTRNIQYFGRRRRCATATTRMASPSHRNIGPYGKRRSGMRRCIWSSRSPTSGTPWALRGALDFIDKGRAQAGHAPCFAGPDV